MKYILVSGGVVSGIGKGVIGTRLTSPETRLSSLISHFQRLPPVFCSK